APARREKLQRVALRPGLAAAPRAGHVVRVDGQARRDGVFNNSATSGRGPARRQRRTTGDCSRRQSRSVRVRDQALPAPPRAGCGGVEGGVEVGDDGEQGRECECWWGRAALRKLPSPVLSRWAFARQGQGPRGGTGRGREARTIEYGTPPASISFSWLTLARI